jgi:hypothetical protein
MASLRAANISFSYTSIGFCKQGNHVGILNMIRPILNYIFECNLQQHWRHCKENGEPQFSLWKSRQQVGTNIQVPPRNLAEKTRSGIFSPICFHPNHIEKKN